MKLNPQRYFYVLIALLVLVLAGGGYGYYWVTTQLNQKTAQLQERKQEVTLADTKQNDLEALKRSYADVQPVLNSLDGALPQTKRESELGLALQSIARQSGMTISTITFPPTGATLPGPTSQTVKQGDVLAIAVTFELSGTYPQLQTFLQKQERLARFTNVVALTISRSDPRGGLKFNISLLAYIKPEAQK